MRAISIDPGSTEISWALLEDIAGAQIGRARLIGCGTRPATIAGLRDIVTGACPRIDVLAVERPKGYIHEHARGAALLDTANVAGGIAWVAPLLGIARVVEMSKAEWTPKLVGIPRVRGKFAGQAGDVAVNAALPRWVEGLPKRSNQDVRDAIGLGVVVLGAERMARRTGT